MNSKPNRYLMLSYLGQSGSTIAQYKPNSNEMSTRYQWKLNWSETARFKASVSGQQFISSIYDNMWQLECWPNGWRDDLAGNMSLYLRLLNPPPFVHKIRVKYSLQCTEMKRKRAMNYEFDAEENQSWGEPKFIPLAAVQDARCLTFTVEMDYVGFTFMKRKKGNVHRMVDPLHIQQIITADQPVQESLQKEHPRKSMKRKHSVTNKGGTDKGDENVNESMELLMKEMKEMKQQMQYQEKLKSIAMKAMSIKMEEQRKVIQTLQGQMQQMSMEMERLKERAGHPGNVEADRELTESCTEDKGHDV